MVRNVNLDYNSIFVVVAATVVDDVAVIKMFKLLAKSLQIFFGTTRWHSIWGAVVEKAINKVVLNLKKIYYIFIHEGESSRRLFNRKSKLRENQEIEKPSYKKKYLRGS